jgi:Zn-dependent peptidase ImmA (M78 family)
MASRTDLVLDAARAALKTRKDAGYDFSQALCPYDAAEKMGVDVRFAGDAPTLEGMYKKGEPPRIVVSALRPPGRQAYTCGHELAHHVFGHGTRIDEVRQNNGMTGARAPEEFLADCFSSFFLMPKTGVAAAFTSREWDARHPTVEQAYAVASYFGAGYTALIHHMRSNLRFLSDAQAKALLRVSPKRIRAGLLGQDVSGTLVVCDSQWTGRPVDATVGDLILAGPDATAEGAAITPAGQSLQHSQFQATAPGICRLVEPQSDWAAFVRVSRREYVGRNCFRYLEEVDD